MIKRFCYACCGMVVTMLGAQESKTIVFAQDTMSNDFREAQVFEVRDEVAKFSDLKFSYTDAEGRTSLLIGQIEKSIAQKPDLLIVGTNDAEAVVPAITKVYQSGIPVIILDRGIKGNAYTTFINSDNIQIGRMGAEFIAKKLGGKGSVLLFEGLQKADVTQLRSEGFLDVIQNYPDIRVIKRTGNYLRRDAIIEMEKLVKKGIKIDAVFSESDSMLSGMRSVLDRYGIDPASMVTVGCDYTSEARDAIRSGRQSASILFPLGGKKSVETARDLLAGKKAPKHIVIPVKLVTNENVEETEPVF